MGSPRSHCSKSAIDALRLHKSVSFDQPCAIAYNHRELRGSVGKSSMIIYSIWADCLLRKRRGVITLITHKCLLTHLPEVGFRFCKIPVDRRNGSRFSEIRDC